MSRTRPDAKLIATRYLAGHATLREPALGSGIDGIVYLTSRQSAIKVYCAERLYLAELAVYRRLRDRRVESICGHAVPRLHGHDDQLWVLEMSCVEPPYVLDFAKCLLDRKQEFDEIIMEEWYQSVQERFGANWDKAMTIYYELYRRYGIYYPDLKPGNVMFGDEDQRQD